jgi:hypothetical protein
MPPAQKNRIRNNRARLLAMTTPAQTGRATMTSRPIPGTCPKLRALSEIADGKREVGTMIPVRMKPKK